MKICRFINISIIIVFLSVIIPLHAQQTGANPAEEVFGKNFKLSVHPTSGTLRYNFSEQTNELESIEAIMDVRLISEKLSLECDVLDFDASENKLIATGDIVRIKQQGISATCGEFYYNPQSGRSELLESPVIVNEDEAGRKTVTRGDKIIIERQEDGRTLVQVSGKASLSSQEGSEVTPKPNETVPAAQQMFGRNFEIVTGEDGELVYSFGAGNVLYSIVARKGVIVSSEQLDLSCNRLEYYSTKNRLLALGNPVKIFQDNLAAQCGRFEYYPEKGQSFLLEDPIILNEDEQGRTMETRGEEIIITQKEKGKTSIIVKGDSQSPPEIEGGEAGEIVEPRQTLPQAPIQITEEDTSPIENIDLMEIMQE